MGGTDTTLGSYGKLRRGWGRIRVVFQLCFSCVVESGEGRSESARMAAQGGDWGSNSGERGQVERAEAGNGRRVHTEELVTDEKNKTWHWPGVGDEEEGIL